MSMLQLYDRARVALAEAATINEVMDLGSELKLVKVYARQIQDRELLADATVLQMRAERRLGTLLIAAKEAGHLVSGRPKKLTGEAALNAPVVLSDLGVDRKLSSRAQQSAALAEELFEGLVENTRIEMRANKAIIVDPVAKAVKQAEVAKRRADHAARTMNGGCVADLHALAKSGKKFKAIYMDPPWKFLTRSSDGDDRSANVHYKTEEVDKIKQLPVEALAADDCALFMWMVDWCPQDALDLIRHYGFQHITTAFTWAKQNESGVGWAMGQGYWTRANPEACWFATRGHPPRLYADVRQLIVAPLMDHSRKPDETYERIERLVEGPYLELQARRPRRGWTSWGDELEFTGEPA